MRKFSNLVILLPIAIILVLLSVANRQSVTLSLDPTSLETPAISISLPFFVFLFLAIIAGMLLGSTLTWISQGKHRKALREKSFETTQLKQEKERLDEQVNDKREEIAPGLPAVR
ncbi:MAG: LapA family protein [Rhizobiaceae bacterium]|nr:LapA family protein [Rhizobiaceae bacterium]